MAVHPAPDDRGFTLVETLVALALLAAVAAGLAQLFGLAIAHGRTARDRTLMAVLAAARLEQLRSLEWALDWAPDAAAVAVGDVSTDFSRDPPAAGGTGLAASPAGSLDVDTAGYVDYLDESGQWAGTLPGVPDRAVYVRRWAIRKLTSPADALGLQVLVAPLQRERSRTSGSPRRWDGQDVLLATIVARRAR